jgi:hypothetical protein
MELDLSQGYAKLSNIGRLAPAQFDGSIGRYRLQGPVAQGAEELLHIALEQIEAGN